VLHVNLNAAMVNASRLVLLGHKKNILL
jgi:hypothetical protein